LAHHALDEEPQLLGEFDRRQPQRGKSWKDLGILVVS
jgi:hypothetical protein